MRYLYQIIAISMWISGIVLAKGFWSTLLAVFFVPWAWYIFIEKVLIMQGFM